MDTRERVFEYIISFKEEFQGATPTLRQIQKACGISSSSVVTFHLKRLARDGRITRTGRNIEIPGARWHQLTEAQISALFFLSRWALEQPLPPLSVIGAADCVHHIGLLFKNDK